MKGSWTIIIQIIRVIVRAEVGGRRPRMDGCKKEMIGREGQ